MVDHFCDFRPDIIIYGHSHVPKIDEINGVRLFNPGSAGTARFGHAPSVGIVTANPDGTALLEHLTLTPA